jgi:hypothetical protein
VRHIVVVLGLAVLVAACGAKARDERSLPLEIYRARNGRVVAFAASGKTVMVSRPSSPPIYMNQPADLAFVERATGRVIASIKGFAVGQPGESEAYAVVDEKLVAMVSKREVPLEMPAPAARYHWRLWWSTVDHEAGTALLVFDQDAEVGVGLGENDADRDRAASRFEVVEVDTRAMTLRGHATISHLGSRMTAEEVGGDRRGRDGERDEAARLWERGARVWVCGAWGAGVCHVSQARGEQRQARALGDDALRREDGHVERRDRNAAGSWRW